MLKRLQRKKGEGVLTGILWMATVAIVTGGIAFGIWTGINTTANASRTSSNAAGTTMTTGAGNVANTR